MHHTYLALLSLTTTIPAFASTLPSTLSPRSISQECVPSSQNGRSNGISKSFFYAFADACKYTIYPNASPETRTADAGRPVPPVPHSIRYSSDQEGWAIRFDYLPPGPGEPANPCNNLKIKCSDLVGKEATGQKGDIGNNIGVCSARNQAKRVKMDAYYHGGARPYTVKDGGSDRECATTLVWRCKPGECGPKFDDKYDPRKGDVVGR